VQRRITTEGLPGMEKIEAKGTKTMQILEGQGTSKGNVKGTAIVMETLHFNNDYTDKILITRATDPGWTVIFPLLKGIITEQGGLLSHASIIARELGIPCVVKVNDATKLIRSGQKIEIDGMKGYVRLEN
jgi:pyruvate,water dikinase